MLTLHVKREPCCVTQIVHHCASYGDIVYVDVRNVGNGRRIQAAVGAYKNKQIEEAKVE